MKYVPEQEIQQQFDTIMQEMNAEIRALSEGGEYNA